MTLILSASVATRFIGNTYVCTNSQWPIEGSNPGGTLFGMSDSSKEVTSGQKQAAGPWRVMVQE